MGKRNKAFWLLLGGGLLVAAMPASAVADMLKEAATANTHAGLAANAPDAKTTAMHLHHLINCLVGQNGGGFDPSVGNPCKDQGDGALHDTKDNRQLHALRGALHKADEGLKWIEKDWHHAQRYAIEAQRELAPILVASGK